MDLSSGDKSFVFATFISLIVIFSLVVGLWTKDNVISELKQEAVQRGAAEWKVSPDGSTTFKWKN